MFNLGPGEIILILLAALLIFGPKKLPELGKSLGQGIRSFRQGTQGLKDELSGSFDETPAPPRTTVVTAAPASAPNDSAEHRA